MVLNKEQLLSISGLKLSGRLDKFDDGRLGRYSAALGEFVEKFSEMEAGLKKALFISDEGKLLLVLSELAEALFGIYADDLAQECENVINCVVGADPEKLEADVTAFLSQAATLSVDIQMEMHKSAEAVRPKTRKYAVIQADAPKSILAVDDVPATLNLLKQPLTAAGYKFSGVTSGAAALDFISKFTPDLIILDIEMPVMNGFELAAKIKETGLGAPIVFLTGNTTRDHLLSAVRAGAAGFIVKPVNRNNVVAKIKRILEA